MTEPIDPHRLDEFVDHIAAGNYVATAARAAGIDPRTVHRWLQRARTTDDAHARKFAERVNAASAQAENDAVRALTTAMTSPRQWRAAAEFLARRFPERWSERKPEQRIRITPAQPEETPQEAHARTIATVRELIAAGIITPDEIKGENAHGMETR